MDATKLDIKTFLYTPGRFFKIPDFQRPYSWEKENVWSFISDLEKIVETPDKKHFFGSIVYVNEGSDDSTIIDGQQRATTVILMLTAIYHILLDHPEKGDIHPDRILNDFLYNQKDYYKEKNRIKLRTVTIDDKIYKKIFEKGDVDSECKESKLYRAYEIFFDYFVGRDHLEKYVNSLENFQIVKILLNHDDDNPQKVFESINSTGKPLSDGDKIRNFALMLNNKDARDTILKDYWKNIESELTEVNKDYISDFFKYYLTSKNQKEVKIDQVYPEFKRLFYAEIGESQEDLKKLENFYGDILNYLDYYTFLKFNKDEDGDYTVVKNNGFRLNYLKVETHFPFLMRVLDEYKEGNIDEKNLVTIFEMLESYLARRIICNIYSTGLNKFFATLHREIENYRKEYPGTSYSDIFSYILLNRTGDLRYPQDGEIEGLIDTNPFYTQRKNYVKFILSSIDDRNKESKLLRHFSAGDSELSIEHIMPQSPNKEWKDDLGANWEEVHQQYLHTLPNLTLTGYNSKYSNNSFKKKKSIEFGFDESPLLINQYVKKFDVWDLSCLKKRTKWWLNQISKIWSTPETTFTPKVEESENVFTEAEITGAKINSIKIFGEIYDVENWISAYGLILEKLFEAEPTLFDSVMTDEMLPRYIKTTKEGLIVPSELPNTPYWIECSLSNNYKKDIVAKLLEYADVNPSEIQVVFERADKDE